MIAAATALFAERGFHGTTMRDIAERAGVNVAAGNYHYGSKKALYLAVLRAQFAEIRATLEARGVTRPESELRHLSRRELVALLRARIRTMLDILIGPPPSPNATLMQREMCDPSEALPVIVREFIRPTMNELEAMVSRLAPGIERRAVSYAALSIVGQALFYRFAMPAVLRVLGAHGYTRDLTAALAEHVTHFSLGGLAAVDHRPKGRRHAR